jgi:hypothetical protein
MGAGSDKMKGLPTAASLFEKAPGQSAAAPGNESLEIRVGLPGHGLSLLPVKGHALPPMTDFIGNPKENAAPVS